MQKSALTTGDAQKAYKTHLESTTKSTSKFATVAKTAKTALGSIASFGLNMLGSMAISWAITAAISAIDNWIHRTEIAIEKGKEAQEIKPSTNYIIYQ